MVEAVEPPPAVWEKIKAEIGYVVAGKHRCAAPAAPPLSSARAPMWARRRRRFIETAGMSRRACHPPRSLLILLTHAFAASCRRAGGRDCDPPYRRRTPIAIGRGASTNRCRDSTRFARQIACRAGIAGRAQPSWSKRASGTCRRIRSSGQQMSSATLMSCCSPRRVKQWRSMAMLMRAIAALLAIYVVAAQFCARSDAASDGPARAGHRPLRLRRSCAARLVAVLQREPNSPAFLLTVDPQSRTLVVRRVSATAEQGRSYELWLIAKGAPAPKSLGLVGSDEFTQRTIPGNFDLATLRSAQLRGFAGAAGGSPSGVPTGPVLFTGKIVESGPDQRRAPKLFLFCPPKRVVPGGGPGSSRQGEPDVGRLGMRRELSDGRRLAAHASSDGRH